MKDGRKEGGRGAKETRGKQARKKCWVSNPTIPTVARQMTLGMSHCHLFSLSGLSTYL